MKNAENRPLNLRMADETNAWWFSLSHWGLIPVSMKLVNKHMYWSLKQRSLRYL